jgi:hypothetical protein
LVVPCQFDAGGARSVAVVTDLIYDEKVLSISGNKVGEKGEAGIPIAFVAYQSSDGRLLIAQQLLVRRHHGNGITPESVR